MTLAPGLYVTATPIGNAADISARALSVLREADGIIAEDTRVTGKLLTIHGISNALIVYNDHNAPVQRPKILARLREGQRLALVTDAGTPLVSDPGYKLVREVHEEGLPVFAVPGPSAALAALSIAGLPSDKFLFAGFLPNKSGARKTALEALRDIPASLILFESAQRLASALADMAAVLGNREAAVARELTKLHEEVKRGRLGELASAYAEAPTPKGEVTLVVAPPEKARASSANADSLLRQALAHMPVSAAAALVAEATGENRRALYARALELKDGELKDGDD
jgi:16S rRNA (cytidine1402-2'-O)-methyltransferase